MSARPKIQPDLMRRLEAFGPAELEQMLNAWEAHQDSWRQGRIDGQDANRQRAAENRGRWRSQYEVLKRDRPTAKFEVLVYDVWQWTKTVGIHVNENGREYSPPTIRADLKKYDPEQA